eukprot:TRINITY_DN71803_c0_g1_i1.p2 TRINITY_DN71803_c0_g1~~TRINITY_DN71803_c0_g1_i1.p2  ORF type:complete len:111 (-),score=8.66 TRINITY_DN71803_c0_g1_i1:959-1291(-)
MINPEVKEAAFDPKSYRSPAPASQPPYAPPETPEQRVAGNYYYQRDARRDFPRTVVMDGETWVPAVLTGLKKNGTTLPPTPPGTTYQWHTAQDPSRPDANTVYYPIYNVK